jgi:hypothetical protein
MKNALFAALLVSLGSSLRAQTLDLPPRPSSALKGTDFARSIAALPRNEREAKIIAEVEAGNVPTFLRNLVPVTVTRETVEVTFHVTPDYLAIGSDDDYFLAPMTPMAAERIARRLGFSLPTPKRVDAIYASSAVKLAPSPIPPSRAMTTVPVFLRHNETVLEQRREKPLGLLTAGHKKDVVIANKVFETPGKVAIYGWHKLDGTPIQPLYTGHSASWVDYSHGVRLVSRRLTVNGEAKMIDEVLADPKLASLLSDEGVMPRTRYPLDDLPEPAPGARYDLLRFDPGVRVVIDQPEADFAQSVLLVFYALPNGNTIEQTIGKAVKPGDDWHFDIQQIGAQTQFLRDKITDRRLVVAYLENDLKSWPAWRKKYGDAGIPALLDAVKNRFPDLRTRVVLSGHSGGGSLIFGYLDRLATIPDEVERIAFLDANYAYETDRHRDKLAAWLKASDAHHLVVLAYNDAVALLDGKPFVSASGGTWGRSHRMLGDLEPSFPFARKHTGEIERCTALDGRVAFLLKENPERKIFHTVQVEKNGFIESLLSGTRLEGVDYTYFGKRAYTGFLKAD